MIEQSRELAKRYKFASTEQEFQKQWEDSYLYKFSREQLNVSRDKTYVIDTPPPTISGDFHIGHVYSYTQTDFIARYKRMCGFNVFYPIGFDANGLATERLVEKKYRIKSHNVPKEEFLKICSEVVAQEEDKFIYILKRIGLSLDWSTKYNTGSDFCRKMSQMSFIDLYNKGEIYREEQPILWDSVDQTALAQADLIEREQKSHIHEICFETSANAPIIVATTRPELLPACVAIFVNPDDSKFTKFINHKAISPLFGIEIPILCDFEVKEDKGTGAVMCCCFGDRKDVFWVKKYKLPYRTIIDKYGKISPKMDFSDSKRPTEAMKYFEELSGLKILSARDKILQLLTSAKALISSKEIIHKVKCAERSSNTIEFLLEPQWFIKTIKHKEAMMQQLEKISWYPKTMKQKLMSWIDTISYDWCISRQRHFGVAIPVWYSLKKGEEGRVILPKIQDLPLNPVSQAPEGYITGEFVAEKDVMDTWATSSITPQINAQGLNESLAQNLDSYKNLFPADLRAQGHEIIRTWTFYTMLKSYLHSNSIPWKNIMISGWCLAEDKTKMSKSKGNVIKPENIIEEYGTDAVRYWSACSRLGSDTVFSLDVIKNGKKLINKLWNAANFISQSSKNVNYVNCSEIFLWEDILLKQKIISNIDKYLIQKLSFLYKDVNYFFTKYHYSDVIHKTETFFLNFFCDYYLEIIKYKIYQSDQNLMIEEVMSSIYTMFYVFKYVLQFLAPFLPHVTDKLFQLIYSQGKSIHHKNSWPKCVPIFSDCDPDIMEEYIKIIDMVRSIKSQNHLALNYKLSSIVVFIESNTKFSKDLVTDLKHSLSAEKILFTNQKKDSTTKSEFFMDNGQIQVEIFLQE